MALLNNLGAAAKGSSITVTLDKSALFAIPMVAVDADFSVQAEVASAEVVLKSTGSHQRKRMFFDLSQSSPSAELAFSTYAKDSFVLSKIILRTVDGAIMIITGSALPSGNDVSLLSQSSVSILGFDASKVLQTVSLSPFDYREIGETSWMAQYGNVVYVEFNPHRPTGITSPFQTLPDISPLNIGDGHIFVVIKYQNNVIAYYDGSTAMWTYATNYSSTFIIANGGVNQPINQHIILDNPMTVTMPLSLAAGGYLPSDFTCTEYLLSP